MGLITAVPRHLNLDDNCHRRGRSRRGRPPTAKYEEFSADLLCSIGQHHGDFHDSTAAAIDSTCLTSVPQHPPRTVIDGAMSRTLLKSSPSSFGSPASRASLASSSAWLLLEALARKPRSRDFQSAASVSGPTM